MIATFQPDSLCWSSKQVILGPLQDLAHDVVSGGIVLERDPFQVGKVGFQDGREAIEFMEIAIVFRSIPIMGRGQLATDVKLVTTEAFGLTDDRQDVLPFQQDLSGRRYARS